MTIETFIFVHDQNIILDFEKNQKFRNLKNLKYVFLGSRPIDQISDMPNLIVARDLPINIEQHKLFTSFSGWYALWKNGLINGDFVNLFEYDVNISEDFWDKLEDNVQTETDVIGYIKYPLDFVWIWNPEGVILPLVKSMYNRRNINISELISKFPPKTDCSMTSNHTMSSSAFKQYMEWMEPAIIDLQSEYYAGHNAERSIMIFALLFKQSTYKIQENVLHHLQLDSHKTQGMGEEKFTSNYNNLVLNKI